MNSDLALTQVKLPAQFAHQVEFAMGLWNDCKNNLHPDVSVVVASLEAALKIHEASGKQVLRLVALVQVAEVLDPVVLKVGGYTSRLVQLRKVFFEDLKRYRTLVGTSGDFEDVLCRIDAKLEMLEILKVDRVHLWSRVDKLDPFCELKPELDALVKLHEEVLVEINSFCGLVEEGAVKQIRIAIGAN